MRRLIVNADDFGRTPGVNEGVIRAHLEGIVTSATLMVAWPAAAEAAREARRHPGLGLGLHVALTGGPPVLDPSRVPSLVDARGCLPSAPEGLARADPGEIRAEVSAQLARFRELAGGLPTHLDTHHHSHACPEVLEALVEVALAERLPVRGLPGTVSERLASAGIATPDRFLDGFHGARADLPGLLGELRRVGQGVSELMCHPAVVDAELRAGSSYAEPRGRELAALTAPQVRQALERRDVELVHFGALRR